MKVADDAPVATCGGKPAQLRPIDRPSVHDMFPSPFPYCADDDDDRPVHGVGISRYVVETEVTCRLVSGM